MKSITSDYQGPLFIVGMPRSGTKLLRDLLNRHPEISLPTVESHFIPSLVMRYGIEPDFEDTSTFDSVYHEFTQTTFYRNMRKQDLILSKDMLLQSIKNISWASIFETILKYYATKTQGKNSIWGDKTPEYIRHLPLLKGLYPRARFLHIIRDPRDYCLSVQKTWGKHPYRAAHNWHENINRFRPEGMKFEKVYKEIYYEELLENPKTVLRDICEFLEIEYTQDMMKLNQPVENHGDARGINFILSDNVQKFSKLLSPQKIKRIEEIVFPSATQLGYKLDYALAYKPLRSVELLMLKFYDGFMSAIFHMREKGVYKGFIYFYDLHNEIN